MLFHLLFTTFAIQNSPFLGWEPRGTVYFSETFGDGWESRWTSSEWKKSDGTQERHGCYTVPSYFRRSKYWNLYEFMMINYDQLCIFWITFSFFLVLYCFWKCLENSARARGQRPLANGLPMPKRIKAGELQPLAGRDRSKGEMVLKSFSPSLRCWLAISVFPPPRWNADFIPSTAGNQLQSGRCSVGNVEVSRPSKTRDFSASPPASIPSAMRARTSSSSTRHGGGVHRANEARLLSHGMPKMARGCQRLHT